MDHGELSQHGPEGPHLSTRSVLYRRIWTVFHKLLVWLAVLTTAGLVLVWLVAAEIGTCQRMARQGLAAAHDLADRVLKPSSKAAAEGLDLAVQAAELQQMTDGLDEEMGGIAGRLLPPESQAGMANLRDSQGRVLAILSENGSLSAERRARLADALDTHARAWLELAICLTNSRWAAHRVPAFTGILVCLLMVATAFSATLESRFRTRGMVSALEGMVEQVRQGELFVTEAAAAGETPDTHRTAALPGVSETFALLVRSLRGRHQAMMKMLDLLSPGVAVLSADWRVQAVNESFCRMLGVSRTSALGRRLEEIFPEAAEEWRAAASGAAAGGSDFQVRDGRSGPVYRSRISQVLPGSRDAAGYVLLLEDPSDLPHADAGARELNRLHESILEGVAEALIIIDRQGVIKGANSMAAGMLGYNRAELAGMPLQRMQQQTADPAQSTLETYLSSPALNLDNAAVKARLVRKDGGVFSAEFRFRDLGLEGAAGYLVSLHDVTQDELAELLSCDRLRVIELIARNQPLELVLSNVTSLIEHQMPGSCCTVLLAKGEQLTPAAGPKLPPLLRQCLQNLTIETAVGPAIDSFFEGKTVAVADLASMPGGGLRSVALDYGLRSYMAAAIFSSEGRVVGMIVVYRPQAAEPPPAQSDLLQLASRLASVCIEQSELNGQLAFRAQHDALTGLLNRPSFEDRLKQAIAQAGRHKRLLGVLSVDMDRFKVVNDTLGHAAGDDLIRQVARRLALCLRETDVLARWGGDEFVIGLLDVRDHQDPARVAEKVLEALKQPFPVAERQVKAGVSIGVSVYPQDGTDVATLVRRADMAMYRAKRSGRNAYRCYDTELGESDQHRLEMETELQGALDRGELTLHYQPLVNLRTGALASLEALMRWRSPRFGLVPPSSFIPIAEETGLVVPIGTHAIREVCRQIKAFEKAGCGRVCISVNVASVQFARPDFVDLVADAVREAGIDPDCLELELTESTLMDVADGSASSMVRLRDLGVRISVDDFGVGYSSLGYLQRLPIDSLKIDRSFVSELGASSRTPLLIESIVSLARSLGMKTTAEGVETVRQLHALEEAGCDIGQGYLLGRPLPARDLLPQLLLQPEAPKWLFRSGAATLTLPSRPPRIRELRPPLMAAPLRRALGKASAV
ncbi:MAG: EAL domain-containing protein [Bryobacterales bacterium]|nr:EAL domain-containing protein [Bryobacterales bacterium]